MPWLTGSKLGFGVQSSGVAIPPMEISGGTKTTHGSYTVHTFLSSGTLVVKDAKSNLSDVALIVVAGGGGGGRGNHNEGAGGGGGGGVVKHPGATLTKGSNATGSYTITVGEGGEGYFGSPTAAGDGTQGEDSSCVVSPTVTYTAKGGGYGPFMNPGNPGGSAGGGGGGGSDNPGGSATQPTQSNPGASQYGNSGGQGIHYQPAGQAGSGNGGGGGGAGGAGESGADRPGGPSGQSCNDLGGAGITIDYRTGSGATYAHGGNGGGAYDTVCPVPTEPANTGNGGTASNTASGASAGGSPGIVVLRFPNAVYNG